MTSAGVQSLARFHPDLELSGAMRLISDQSDFAVWCFQVKSPKDEGMVPHHAGCKDEGRLVGGG